MSEMSVCFTVLDICSLSYYHCCNLVLYKSSSSVDLLCVAEVWHNRDEKQNFLQSFDAQLVREEKRLEVEEELRVQVGAELSSGACDE